MYEYRKLNEALKESCRDASEMFHASTRDVKKSQERKLLSIIRNNSETEFGKTYNFSDVESVSDFRSSIPITTYERYEDYVVQIAEGKKRVLTMDTVLMLEPTSGSTSPSKFIPYTESLKREFQQGIFPWLYDLYSRKPELLDGSFYWSITPVTHKQERTSGGIPIGFGDDGAYFTQEQQGLIAQLSAVPFDVAQIQDIEEFRDKTLHYLTKNKDLSFISVWNPTFLSLLLRPLTNTEKLWPNLSLISAWADGNASNHIPEIRRLFPKTEIQGKGLIATEGFVSLPLVGYEGSALSVNSHFFEFRNLQDQGDVRLAHEVEKGREYEVILTTSGGLYRYNLEDIVEVVGFNNQCPLIKFSGRNNNVSDLFGEKLNEYHVSKALKKVFQDFSLMPSFFMLAPETNEDTTSYTIFIETARPINKRVSLDLDSILQENYHYKYCRKLGQLGNPGIFLINPDQSKTASDVYLDESQKKGKKIGNVKPSTLSSQVGWSRIFNGRFIN